MRFCLITDSPMIAQASTLVLFNKKLRILPINVGITNVQNPLDFVTALLVDRHKRGRLRHRGAFTLGLIIQSLNYRLKLKNI